MIFINYITFSSEHKNCREILERRKKEIKIPQRKSAEKS
jgi:hypothetical protein